MPDQILNSISTTSFLTVNGAAGVSAIDFVGDQDWFRVSLAAGTAYQFRLNGNGLSDAYLRLLDSAGNQMTFNNDNGDGTKNSLIGYTPTSGGTFYLSAQGYGNSTGAYSLTATTRPSSVDILNTTATTSVLVVNGAAGVSTIGITGVRDDQDWFRVSLAAGTAYQFRLNGYGSLDACLRLLDSAGNQITFNNDNGDGTKNSLIGYTPTSGGTFYLSAQGYGGSTGDYSLMATTFEDILNTTATTSDLSFNRAAEVSAINFVGDQDWFRISLTAGEAYEFRLNGYDSVDAYLRLLDSTGNEIRFNDNGDDNDDLNSLISYTPTSSGTFYLSAQSNGSGTGIYSLIANRATTPPPPPDNIINNATTTSVLYVNRVAEVSVINFVGDQDWFRVSLTSGTAYQFRLNGDMNANGLSDPYLRLLDYKGNEITFNDDGDDSHNSLIIYDPTTSGSVYLSAQGHGSSTGAYSLTATAISPSVDILNTTATTSVLAVNGIAGVSTIGVPGDQDWFRVSLTAGEAYEFRLNGYDSLNAYLRLLDSTGNEIRFNNDGGGNLNSLISYTPTTSGTFYLSAQGYYGSTGYYSLMATTVDILNTTATTSVLAVNGIAGVSTIGVPGDQDWFRVSLTAGTAYQFRLNGYGSVDAYLRLLGSTGNEITFNNDGGGNHNSLISYTPTTSGTFYLSAQGYGGNTGDYVLMATSVTAPPPPSGEDILNTTATTSVLAVNGAAGVSTIGVPGDQDWFRVSLTAGTAYQFRLNGNGLSDAYLRLLGSTGNEIKFNDDGGGNLNSLISYTPTTSGTFYLSAQGHGSSTGAYLLTAATTSPLSPLSGDILNTTVTTSALAVNGIAGVSTIGAPGDQDWFRVSLTGVAFSEA